MENFGSYEEFNKDLMLNVINCEEDFGKLK